MAGGDRERPQRDAGQQRPVVLQQVGRTAATLFLMDEVEIPEYPVEREDQREAEVIGVELLHRLGADRVDHIRDERRRGDDADHLVEQVGTVFLQDRPVAGSAVCEQDQLVAALAEREEQREQQDQDQQPVADRHVDGDRAARRAQHEADRDHQDVDDDDMLQRT